MGRKQIDALSTMTAEEAAQFFADVDPEALVGEVRETSDQTLLELIGNEVVRSAAVTGILDRLDEYAVPERLAEVKGLVRFDLRRRDVVIESQLLEFEAGGLRVIPADEVSREPGVVITTSLLRFVRLVSGEHNAALEFLSGHLDIEGDEHLALAVGTLFRIPGTDEVAFDPTALDPVDVATAIKDVSTDHLRKVMSGVFRPIVLDEIFRRLPDFVNPRRAAKVRLVVALRLTGNGSTEDADRYVVHVDQGHAVVHEGEAEELTRDATVTCEAHDFLRLATGNMNAVAGVLKGRLKVRGDRARALQLSSVIDIPSAR